jgi:hypothetical protein
MSQPTQPRPNNVFPVLTALKEPVNNDALPGEPHPAQPLEQPPGKVTHVAGRRPQKTEETRKLILTLEGEVIREYPIGARNMSIGRKHGNDIQLNDLTLSGRHAMISSLPDYVFIEDLGSTNGTMVNGNHIKKVALEHGDIIQVGHHQLTYLCEAESKYEPTMFVKAEFDETQVIYTGSENEDSLVKGIPLGGLRTLNGSIAKAVMELRKTYNTIGFQGKRMALITRGTKGYTITAVTSTRSRRASDIPKLNGKPLSTKQEPLKPDDIIDIAGFEVQFYYLT